MEYRVLIKLFVPEIEENYEFRIPINKTIDEITDSLNKVVNDLAKFYPIKPNPFLCNRNTGEIYERAKLIRETDIKNGSELIIF